MSEARLVWVCARCGIAHELPGGCDSCDGPTNPYLLLPVTFEDGEPVIHGWKDTTMRHKTPWDTDCAFVSELYELAREAKEG